MSAPGPAIPRAGSRSPVTSPVAMCWLAVHEGRLLERAAPDVLTAMGSRLHRRAKPAGFHPLSGLGTLVTEKVSVHLVAAWGLSAAGRDQILG